MVQGKITEADTPTIQWVPLHPDQSATHLHHPPIFTSDALPAASLPLYPGLEHILAGIRNGVVVIFSSHYYH